MGRLYRVQHGGALAKEINSKRTLSGRGIRDMRRMGLLLWCPDMDTIDLDAVVALPANVLPFRLEPRQPGVALLRMNLFTHCDLMAWITSFSPHPPIRRYTSGQLDFRSILDSMRSNFEKRQ